MKRMLVIAVGGIAVAFAAAIAVIWLVTGAGAPPQQAQAPAPGAPVAGGPQPQGGLIDPGKMPLSGLPPSTPTVIVKDEPPPPPPPGSWEAVPILRARRGGNVLELSELQPRLSECFGDGARRGGTFTRTKDFAPLVDEATTILVLQVEIVRGEALVVDAPVESQGTASEGTLACAQAVLRNAKAPGAGLPDGRHRIRFLLAQ